MLRNLGHIFILKHRLPEMYPSEGSHAVFSDTVENILRFLCALGWALQYAGISQALHSADAAAASA